MTENRWRVRALPDFVAEVWIFDLDNTLYPADCNLFAQIDERMGRFIAGRFGLEPTEAKALQKQFFRDHGTTLRGLMLEHAVPPEEFLAYVHDIDLSPVRPAPDLDRALDGLPGRKLVFTNGSIEHAERVLSRLGVTRHFEAVFDIRAADYLPKPDPLPYRRLIQRFGIEPRATAMVEDIARNLEPAAMLGMTTVWVPNEREWSRTGDVTPEYVHHVVDDLVLWLERAAEAVAGR